MTFQPTQDGAMVVMPFVRAAKNWQNNLWFSKTDFNQADQLALANLVHNEYFAALDSALENAVNYGPPTCYDMRSIDGPVVIGTAPVSTGESLGELAPLSVAVVVTHYTAKRGRAHRGRTYLTGFTESVLFDGAWDAAFLLACTGLFGAMATDAAAIGWTFGVRSGQLDGVPRATAVVTPITSSVVRSAIPGNQRKRADRP